MARRWDRDDRGEGVADATAFVAGAAALVEAMGRPRWVAEEPELHLLPHLQRGCRSLPLEITDAHTSDEGSYEVALRWTGQEPGQAEVRAAIFSLVGSFAEASNYVRQQQSEATEERLVFEVVTGFLPGEGRFAPHGHTLRLTVSDLR